MTRSSVEKMPKMQTLKPVLLKVVSFENYKLIDRKKSLSTDDVQNWFVEYKMPPGPSGFLRPKKHDHF